MDPHGTPVGPGPLLSGQQQGSSTTLETRVIGSPRVFGARQSRFESWVSSVESLIMGYVDPAQRKAYHQQYYLANKAKIIARAGINRQKGVDRIRELVKQAKDLPCSDCNTKYPYYVMQFDHVRGIKLFAIANCARGGHMKISDVLAEIAKCDVVCANCHAIRTHERRQTPVA